MHRHLLLFFLGLCSCSSAAAAYQSSYTPLEPVHNTYQASEALKLNTAMLVRYYLVPAETASEFAEFFSKEPLDLKRHGLLRMSTLARTTTKPVFNVYASRVRNMCASLFGEITIQSLIELPMAVPKTTRHLDDKGQKIFVTTYVPPTHLPETLQKEWDIFIRDVTLHELKHYVIYNQVGMQITDKILQVPSEAGWACDETTELLGQENKRLFSVAEELNADLDRRAQTNDLDRVNNFWLRKRK